MKEQYEEFEKINEIIKLNSGLYDWFTRNQHMMIGLGLTDSKKEYSGDNKNIKIFAEIVKITLTCLYDIDYSDITKARLATRRIKKAYKLYKNDVTKTVSKQLKLTYPKSRNYSTYVI